MAFYSGSVSSASDLLLALQNACVAEGWLLTGAILEKSGCFVEVFSETYGLRCRGGTSRTGSTLENINRLNTSQTNNNLPDLQASLCGVGSVITFPLNYFIHIFNNPDEVYLVVNYGIDSYSYMSFGKLKNYSSGTGNWYAALAGNMPSNKYLSSCSLSESTGGNAGTGWSNVWSCAAPFAAGSTAGVVGNSPQAVNAFIHHQLDGAEWTMCGNSVGDRNHTTFISTSSWANAWAQIQQITSRQPSIWNQEAILIPIQPSIYRSSSKISQLGELENARYVRINNYEPEQILSLGSDRWKIYPFHKKNILSPNSTNSTHTGTFGWAIRYDGP